MDLTGHWLIDDHHSVYGVEIRQVGNRVSGGYEQLQGTIDGVVEGNVVKFRWDQPTNRRAGDGQLVIAGDGMVMSGTWSYDPHAYNSGLQGGGEWTFRRQPPADSAITRFYEQLRSRLTHRKYLALESPGGLIQRAFSRDAHGLIVTRRIGVIDARSRSESPTQMFEQVKDWYAQTGHGVGEGLLIFVYAPAPPKALEEIKKSHFYAGSISVTACAYDLTNLQHWFSYAGAWEDEVFGSS